MNDFLTERARITPDGPAILQPEEDRRIRYGEWNERALNRAGRFVSAGVDKGDRVGVLLEDPVEFATTFFASMKRGATTVAFPPEWPDQRLRSQMKRLNCNVLICSGETHRSILKELEGIDVFSVDENPCEGGEALSQLKVREIRSFEWSGGGRVDCEIIPLVMFTSGSTGEPQPVKLGREQLYASAMASAVRLGVASGDLWLDPLPVYHIGGLSPFVRSTLYGTTVASVQYEPERILEVIQRYDVTGMSLVPTMLKELVSQEACSVLSSLRFVLLGGGPIPGALIKKCRNLSIPVCPTYGMTETASQVATALPDQAYDQPETCGKPLLNTTVRILNEGGKKAEPGQEGEIVVEGPQVMEGYLDNPERTEEKFGEQGFYTGDRGYLDEQGNLYVTGRTSKIIVTGGEQVSVENVENVLEQHPEVQEATVTGLEDEHWGENVYAVITVPEDHENIDGSKSRNPDSGVEVMGMVTEEHHLSALLSSLNERLAPHEVPGDIMVVNEFPRTPSGTIDREVVREIIKNWSNGVME